MQNIFINRALRLRSGDVATLQVNGPFKLLVGNGRVWVTMEGVEDDFWLSGGEHLEIAGKGMLVIEGADANSQLQLGLPRQHWFVRLTVALRGWRRPAGRLVANY